MKKIILIFSVLFLISCDSTFKVVEESSEYSTLIKRGRVRGVIFNENSECFMCFHNENRFTPTLEEILKSEQILKDKLKETNKTRINQFDNCPRIDKKLNSYRRQYFGYIDTDGDKIIYTTFNWDRYSIFDKLKGYSKDKSEKWKTTKEIINDGCSYHWEIKINITTKELFDLEVNGL